MWCNLETKFRFTKFILFGLPNFIYQVCIHLISFIAVSINEYLCFLCGMLLNFADYSVFNPYDVISRFAPLIALRAVRKEFVLIAPSVGFPNGIKKVRPVFLWLYPSSVGNKVTCQNNIFCKRFDY